MQRTSVPWLVALLGAAVLATGCAGNQVRTSTTTPPEEQSRTVEPSMTGESEGEVPSARDDERTPSSTPTPAPVSGGPRPDATLTIPSLDVRVVIVSYRGRTDDAPGSDIQNGGLAASPYGPGGGAGPGEIGNFQVTAHRTSSTRPFKDLPDLKRGERVFVDVGGVRYVYRVVDTRRTSFRSAESLRAQRAAVPGQPGAAPTQAMITLSTCATHEDHADGNFWHDEFGNPEHRIDKIGRLVAVRDTPS